MGDGLIMPLVLELVKVLALYFVTRLVNRIVKFNTNRFLKEINK